MVIPAPRLEASGRFQHQLGAFLQAKVLEYAWQLRERPGLDQYRRGIQSLRVCQFLAQRQISCQVITICQNVAHLWDAPVED